MYWTRKSIYEEFDVHGFDSLADHCDEIFSLEKISNFTVNNNASKYLFKVKKMKKIATEKEIKFLDQVEIKIKENIKKRCNNNKDNT